MIARGALAALAALVAVATVAPAETMDPLPLGSDEMSPDFDTPPSLSDDDEAILPEAPPAELEMTPAALLESGEPAPPAGESPPATDDGEPRPTRSAKKEAPVPGIALLLGGAAALAIARRRE